MECFRMKIQIIKKRCKIGGMIHDVVAIRYDRIVGWRM